MKSTDLKEFLLGPFFEIAYENEHWLNSPLLPPSIILGHFFQEERSKQFLGAPKPDSLAFRQLWGLGQYAPGLRCLSSKAISAVIGGIASDQEI